MKRPRHGVGDRLTILLAGLLILGMAIQLVHPIATIGFVMPKNYNEGWNAYHAARLAAGEALYDGNAWRPNNYPFVSFYVIAALKPLFGDVLIAGRAVSLASLAAIAQRGECIRHSIDCAMIEEARNLAALIEEGSGMAHRVDLYRLGEILARP